MTAPVEWAGVAIKMADGRMYTAEFDSSSLIEFNIDVDFEQGHEGEHRVTVRLDGFGRVARTHREWRGPASGIESARHALGAADTD